MCWHCDWGCWDEDSFLIYTDCSYQVERLRVEGWSNCWCETWGGGYTAFILCCNTHKQSLAKDNTCRKEAAASVHVYIYTKSSQLLSCSSRGVCQVSWMPMTSCTLKSRQHFFPALVKKKKLLLEEVSQGFQLWTSCSHFGTIPPHLKYAGGWRRPFPAR